MASSADEGTPQFSPDGLQIAFQSTRSGYDEIWVTNRDGSNARQLTNIRAGIEGFPHWSPDGKKIVFHSRQSIGATLFIVDAAGGRPHRLTDEPGDDFGPSWSRNGQWIYFASRRTGETHVWKISAKGGPATQITRHRGSRPIESPDQRYLFYTNSDDSAVWRVRLPEGPEEKILPDVAGWGTAFDVTNRGIYFIGPEISGAGQRLAFFSFGTGHITSLAATPGEINYGLAASPDDLVILYAQRENVGSDLMLVENFR
jgi:dipeptidyl aminopeptidase/acylaminoacyl peptidase